MAINLKMMATFGVAGNFTGHLEQAGEAVDFTNVKTNKTVITKEYPTDWQKGMEAYYPINDEKNIGLYDKYVELAKKENIIFAGRLGQYKYFDMDKTMLSAMEIYNKIK